MKFFALILALCLALASCGGDSSTGAEHEGTPPLPQAPDWSGPPPSHVVVRDIKKGTGPLIKAGKAFSVRYVSFEYGSDDVTEDHWSDDSTFSWAFGPGKVVRAWVKGLPGMRVGGQRELIAPSRLAYGTGAKAWVVELLSVGE